MNPQDDTIHPPARRTLLDALATATLALAGIALVVMSLVQAWQVYARYVLNSSPGWTEPVALLFMSLAVMFGAAIAVRNEAHFAFPTLVENSPPPMRRALKAFARLVAVAAGLGLMVMGGYMMVDDWGVAMPGAPLPAGLKFLALFVGGALIAIFAVERLLKGDVEPAE